MTQSLMTYSAPAKTFNQGLPLGNGRLGAFFYGGTHLERIHLNEDSLWTGTGPAPIPPEGREAIPEIRRRLFAGQLREAHDLSVRTLPGPFTEAYQPVGDLILELPASTDPVTNYSRTLDLDSAVGITRFQLGNVTHTRELLVSYPAQVIALRWSVDQPGALSCSLHLESLHPHKTEVNGNNIQLTGNAPSHVIMMGRKKGDGIYYGEPAGRRGMAFVCGVSIHAPGAKISHEGKSLQITGATEVVVILAIATGFRETQPEASVQKTLNGFCKTDWETLKNNHSKDFQSLFGKVRLQLSSDVEAIKGLSIEQRIARRNQGFNDPALDSLLFDYGRYLLISSSRPGSLPANLQGIWNHDRTPPWWSNYTININLQMNYWLAEVCGLEEVHAPLFDYIDRLCIHGAKTARELYGCEGWVTHHQTDLWASATPVGLIPDEINDCAAIYALWPMGGAWLSRHLFEHYQYSQETSFLRERAWPVLRGASTFMLDFLTPQPDGVLTTAPSTSPENRFVLPDGFQASITTGCTMDLSIIRDLFNNTLEAERILGGIDPVFTARISETLNKLPPIQVTSSGRIPEWDKDFLEMDEGHRHISHLYGLYPGVEFDPLNQPELAQAAQQTLIRRGDLGTGWSLAWKILFWARLGDGEHAYRLITNLFAPVHPEFTDIQNDGGGIYPNLLTACPPFQIDANFGYTAGVTEMLLQSHRHTAGGFELVLLPALPKGWSSGSVKGLRARGGFVVNMEWENGQLTDYHIFSSQVKKVAVRINNSVEEIQTELALA